MSKDSRVPALAILLSAQTMMAGFIIMTSFLADAATSPGMPPKAAQTAQPGLTVFPDDGRRLVLAARYGQATVVLYLLNKGIAADSRDEFGNTPLIAAAESGYAGIVHLLLDKGADVNVQNLQQDTPLMVAARNGHGRIMSLLLDKGADANIRRSDGRNALFDAVTTGKLQLVRTLLAAGADPNVHSTGGRSDALHGYTPLMLVVRLSGTGTAGSWAAIARALIAKGAALDTPRPNGETALDIATGNADQGMVRLLRQAGALESQSVYAAMGPGEALVKAAATGDPAKMRKLLAGQANVDTVNQWGVTPLIAAVVRGHYDAIALLAGHGARIDKKAWGRPQDTDVLGVPLAEQDLVRAGARNDTALIVATRRGDEKAASFLVAHGAKVLLRNRRGESAAQLAVDLGYGSIIRLFLDHGLDANQLVGGVLPEAISSRPGATAGTPMLIRAAKRGHGNVVQVLLRAGAGSDIQDSQGMTALYWTAAKGLASIAKLLLRHHADPNVKTRSGMTALMVAAQQGHGDLVHLLIDNRADVNAREVAANPYGYNKALGSGRTALIYAAEYGDDRIVRMLLEAGAYKQLTARSGASALAVAVQNGHKEIVRLLQ